MNIIDTYYQDIKHYPLLTAKQEQRLSLIIQKSQKEAQRERAVTKLVLGNLRLVLYIANKIYRSKRSISYMDVIQEGNQYLFVLARKYDYAKHGYRFSTFAQIPIIHRMSEVIRSDRFIRIPEPHYYFSGKIDWLRAKYGEDLTDEIILDKLKISRELLRLIRLDEKTSVAYSGSLSDIAKNVIEGKGGFRTTEEYIEESQIYSLGYEIERTREYLNKIMKDVCPLKVQKIIHLVFYEGKTMEEAGAECGVTKQCVSKQFQTYFERLKNRIVWSQIDMDGIN